MTIEEAIKHFKQYVENRRSRSGAEKEGGGDMTREEFARLGSEGESNG